MSQCIRLCENVGVKVAVCIQPWLELTRRRLGMDFLDPEVGPAHEETLQVIRRRMSADHDEQFFDLTGIFDRPDQLGWYTDACHLDDRGQEVLGRVMARVVRSWGESRES